MKLIKILKVSILIYIVSIVNNNCFGQEVDYMKLLMSGVTIDSLDIIMEKKTKINTNNKNQGEIEDGELAQYSRWRSYWKDRLTITKEYPKGSPLPFLKALASTTVDPVCQNNGGSTPIPHWKQLGPFEGQALTGGVREHAIGAVFAVATLPTDLNTVYIGTGSGGLWKTTNALSINTTWTNMTDGMGMPSLGFSDIIIDPNNPNIVYAAASNPRHGYGIGVIKSINGGLNWNPTGYFIDPYIENSPPIRKLLFSPSNTNHIYLLTDTELFKSENGGDTWQSMGLALASGSGNNFKSMDFNKSNTNLLYVGGTQTWKFDILMNLWQRLDNTIPSSIIPTAQDSFHFYSSPSVLSGVDNGLYIVVKWVYQHDIRLTEFYTHSKKAILKYTEGSGWNIINANHTYFAEKFIVNPVNNNIMYLGHDDRPNTTCCKISKSINGGINFVNITNYHANQIYNGVSTHADIRAMKLISPSTDGLSDVVLVGDDGGVILTQTADSAPNYLVNWKDLNGTGLAITEFSGISNNEWDANIIHGGAQDNGVFTYNQGVWRRTEMGDGFGCVNDPTNLDIAFCQYNYPSVRKTNDKGQTWISYTSAPYCNACGIPSPGQFDVSKWPHVFDNSNIEYIGRRELYKKEPGGSWQSISNFSSNFCFLCPPPDGSDPNRECCISHLVAIDVSKSDNKIIFAAFGGAVWERSSIYRLFKTIDGGGNWQDISPQSARWYSISDVISDPNNPNKIWVSFAGIGINSSNGAPQSRVNFSPDGGLTWQDWSVDLPVFPVNDIIYQNGTQDLIYAATDVGVFYRKAGDMNTPWRCLKGNMPVVHVKDMEISYCSGKLRAATYGRGVWEADLVEVSNFSDIVINSNTTYSDKKLINSNIIISSGATLTITNTGYLNISPGKSIVVKQGGRLIIDGGTLTNNCGKFWKGIEVWGTYSSNNLMSQGRVIIKSNATISNAEEALRMWKPGDYNSSGGIIIATDSKFINNKRSAEFISYPFPYLNRGIFKNCEFITNNDYPTGAQMPFGYITMWNVNGVEFKGCDFINSNDLFKYKFNGIYSIDASYNCTGYCDPSQPLCSMIKSRFANLKSGIESIGPNGVIEIWDSEFTSNAIGVNLNNAHNSKLIRNDFKIIKAPSSWFGIGMLIANSSRYIIENNEFSRFGVFADPLCGLVISNSGGDVPFPIQNNLFSNLNAGTYVLGTNSIFNGCPFGLQYYCNEHLSTGNDIYIDGTIQKIQRFNSGMITSSGNKFSTSSYSNYVLNGLCNIDYYYNNSNPNETPTISGAINLIPVTDINLCPSNYPIGNGTQSFVSSISTIKELEKQIVKMKGDFKSLEKAKKNLIDKSQNNNYQVEFEDYNALNISSESNFSNVLNFIYLDTTLTIGQRKGYISKLYLTNQSNEAKYNLFLLKTFNRDYVEAEKLLRSYNFIKLNEINEIAELINILTKAKVDSQLLFDKFTIDKISRINKSTKFTYSKHFSNLILERHSASKPFQILMTTKFEEINKTLIKIKNE